MQDVEIYKGVDRAMIDEMTRGAGGEQNLLAVSIVLLPYLQIRLGLLKQTIIWALALSLSFCTVSLAYVQRVAAELP